LEGFARIVLGVTSPQLAEEVVDFLDRTGRARVVATASSAADLARVIAQGKPHAVVGEPDLVRSAGGVDGSAFLAVETAESVRALRSALEMGARGFYLWPAERTALAAAAVGTIPPPTGDTGSSGLVVAVYGPRGGVGTTFVATHLAAAFARRGQDTVLVDVDPAFADVTTALGAGPEGTVPGSAGARKVRTIADLGPVAEELSPRHLEEVLWSHSAGFRVLLAPLEPGREPDPFPAYRRAVRVLAATVDAVVLHLPRVLPEGFEEGLGLVDRILVVLSLDVLSFRAARRALGQLSAAGLADRCEFLVNRAARAEIVPGDVQRVFGRSPLCVVPTDRRARTAQDRGRLVAGRGGAIRSVDRLAARLLEKGAGR
jgi:pilus assembly protein CpaE